MIKLCTIECHDQFYCENNFCKPRCDSFGEQSDVFVVASDVLVAVSAVIGSIAGSTVLVISCLRHKRMYVLTENTSSIFLKLFA